MSSSEVRYSDNTSEWELNNLKMRLQFEDLKMRQFGNLKMRLQFEDETTILAFSNFQINTFSNQYKI